MRCNDCGYKTCVLQTIPVAIDEEETNLRKRLCPGCKRRFDTMEKEIPRHARGQEKSASVSGIDEMSGS